MAEEPAIALLEAAWASIATLGATLDDAQWDLPTDCPGWTVRDNLSHIIGIENMLRGEPADPPIDGRPEHVRNDFGAFNELAVAARRERPGAAVLAEFRAVTAARLAALRALPAEKWDEIGPTPTGQDTYRHFMRIHAFDSWVHEQDMRRAVGIPGHLSGPVVDLVLDWHRRNIGYVVGKRGKAPEGSVVTFALRDAAPITVAVRDGRAAVVDDVAPSTVLTLDVETFNALLCGRWQGERAIEDGRVELGGDEALGAQVARSMAYLF